MRDRSSFALRASVVASAAVALTYVAAGEREARACGGCFHPPTQVASDITDERMLLSVSQKQTTLYDQIRYSGSPSSFAWVLPIHGTVDVGLSADVLFDSIDTLTTTTITPPPSSCSGPPSSCAGGGAFSAPTANAGSSAGDDDGVTITKSQNVGPYETVQLHATDSSALNNWLAANGFSLPSAVAPIIAEYVAEGFDFLAMKLLPNAGVQSMRPVRVTTQGASLSLPLRMAAIGTGTSVGITIWVVSDGRYQPQNFPYYHIEDSALVWDWNASISNYTTLRSQHEAELGGKGWEIESSIDLSQALITNVIVSGGQYYSGGGVSAAPEADAGEDYLPITTSTASNGGDGGSSIADGGSVGSDGGTTESADQVRQDDIDTLFGGLSGPNVRVTRIRSDIAHAAMTVDFLLQASPDQSELSNVRTVTQSINEVCPVYQGCSVVGTGTPAQAAASVADANNATDAAGGGCTTVPSSNRENGLRFGLLAGALGLVAYRIRRRRR